tara:strand:+ start:188 stop:454 length:267 start_codon:yes stop_codon:yes gene_type:complete
MWNQSHTKLCTALDVQLLESLLLLQLQPHILLFPTPPNQDGERRGREEGSNIGDDDIRDLFVGVGFDYHVVPAVWALEAKVDDEGVGA